MSGHVDQDEASADRTEDRAHAARLYSELTKAQRSMLYWALFWTGREDCVGVGASGPSIRACDALVDRKLCTFVGMCVNFDDHNARERPTYGITPLGRIVAEFCEP